MYPNLSQCLLWFSMYAILDCHIAYLSSSWLLEVYDFLCVRFHSRHSSANRSEERFAADDSIALSFLTPRFHCMHWNCCTRRDATQTHSQRDRAISRRREPRRTSRGVDPASIVRRLANTCAHAEGWPCNYNTIVAACIPTIGVHSIAHYCHAP